LERDRAECSDDNDRLTTLMLGQQRELFLYIYSLVHRFDDANDILQEVNLAVWRDAKQSANVADFRSWTYRIAYNQILTYRKRQGRLKLHFDDSLLANLAEKAQSQDELAEAYQAALRHCSRTLPAPNWQLLAMRYQESLSVTAIAHRLGRSATTVSQSLYRVRAVLLKCIRERLAKADSRQEERA
jgi:RNA polymerase sigma-70 factor, ECF subfamily